MNRTLLGRAAITSLMLGVATIACTPHAGMHPAALADQAPKADDEAAKLADKARDALAHNRGDEAVSAAEDAVAILPNDAGYRMLLGQSYLAAGRFASAETSFKDTLALKADQPKARFDLALAQIAQGRGQEAQADLKTLVGGIASTDLGLALTLAGDHATGIQMLVDAARMPDATVRTRQNLALAYGLDGQWREAQAVAMQDTSPDRLKDQLAGWAALAGPQAGPTQIAAMLGVTPVADAGQPARLALNTSAAPIPGQPPVALAMADTPPTAPVPAAPVATADQAPVAPASVTVPLSAPEAETPPMLVAQADGGSVSVPLEESKPATPLMLAVAKPQPVVKTAAVVPSDVETPRLLRSGEAPQAAFRPAVQIVPVTHHHGNYVVQLGAFARSGAVETAWSRAAKQAPTLASYSPSHAQYKTGGTALARLSITGFETRADAQKLCGRIKARGGDCFVRASAGDAPLEWVRRDTGTQVASR